MKSKKRLPLILTIAVEIIFLIFFHCLYTPYKNDGNVSSEISYLSSDRMISSVELNSDLLDWTPFEVHRQSILKHFAYAKIQIENPNIWPHTYYILNQDVNKYSSLMEYNNFQMFPVEKAFPGFNRTVYKVTLLPGMSKTCYFEFRNDDIIAVSPVVLSEETFFAQGTREQFFLLALVTLVLFCAFFILAEFFIIRSNYLIFVGAFSVMVAFCYVSSFQILGKMSILPLPPITMKILVKTFQVSFLMFVIFMSVSALYFYRKDKLIEFTTYLSFVPWLLFEGISCAGGIFGARVFCEHTLLLSYLLSLFTFGIFILRATTLSQKEQQDEIVSYFTLTGRVSFQNLLKTKNLPSHLLIKVRDKLQQPLEIIQAISSMMTNGNDFSEIVAYSTVISRYVLEMKKILGIEFAQGESATVGGIPKTELQEFDSKEFEKYKNTTICIYGSNDDIILSEKIILNSEGFYCVTCGSYEDIIGGIEAGEYQMLIINPATDGHESFEICKKIREKYNLLQFPILMIINYYANHLVRSGYGAGVNDFVIRPFDSSELMSRCFSLLQLKNVFLHNQELVQLEREKSTFLYFVTHNVNTPLTILLNRLDELQTFEKDMSKEELEITRDVREAVSEINGIIQNVLFSFRISDGRFVNVQEKLFVEDILDLIRPALESKASSKEVKILWNIQEILPQVDCNRQALRGIITNLIDNAVKYSPVGGKVMVSVREEKGHIVLSVCDEGDGVPSDKVPLLFSRFEDMKKKKDDSRPSVGLGLYVANELAKLNGIKLEYRDADIGGACFMMTFPG